MSERDADITGNQVGCPLILVVIAIMATILMINKKTTDETRDLQRRVGQLESERR